MKGVVFVTIEQGVLVRNKIDDVGNNLTCRLHWCDTHHEPVWIYGDGSYCCPHDQITDTISEHQVVDFPQICHD